MSYRLVLAAATAGVIMFTQPATAVAALTPSYGPATVEQQDPGRQFRAMPALHQVRWTDGTGTHQRLIRSFQISPDDGGRTPVRSRIQYQDGSGAWQEALDARTGGPLLNAADAQYAKVGNAFTASNGAVVILDEQARKDSGGRFVYRWSSTDGGVRWSPTKAYIDLAGAAVIPEAYGHAFQGVIQLPDGTQVMPFYAAHKATYDENGEVDATWSAAHLLAGGRDGTGWRRAATVFKSEQHTYSEAAVTRLQDGRLLMIARFDVWQGGLNYSKLLARRTTGSVDSAADLASVTWATAYTVKVPGAADETVVRGVSPTLRTMDQGVVMLVFGRPRNKITFSYDHGTTWITAHNFYDNLPVNCTTGYAGHPCADLGSSGYMGVAVTSSRTATIIGDNCQAGWGCVGGYTYPRGTEDQLWFGTVTLR